MKTADTGVVPLETDLSALMTSATVGPIYHVVDVPSETREYFCPFTDTTRTTECRVIGRVFAADWEHFLTVRGVRSVEARPDGCIVVTVWEPVDA